MAKLFGAFILAAALIFGLGTVPSYACPEKAAQAGDATIQLAQDESSDEGTDEEPSGEEDSGAGDESE